MKTFLTKKHWLWIMGVILLMLLLWYFGILQIMYEGFNKSTYVPALPAPAVK
jgi:hypothetical protein